MPLTNVTFNNDAIKNKGGKKFAIRKVNSDGSNISGELWTDWTYREKSSMEFAQPLEEIKDESGEVVANDEGDVKTEFKITALQSDAKMYTFLKDDVKNSYFSLYLDGGEDSGTATQYWYVPITKIERGFSVSSPGRRPEITFRPQYNASAFSLSASSISGGSISAWGAAGTQTVAAGAYFSVTGV